MINTLRSTLLRDTVGAEIAQMGERQSEDLKTPGSIQCLDYFGKFRKFRNI